MPRFVIERDIPEIGSADHTALQEAATKSNEVLADMRAHKKRIQWEHSYITGNKTFCIYIAEDESLIQEHSERSGFPATIVTEVTGKLDPVTAEG
jgi:Nickel responsive protein SCO4226-like